MATPLTDAINALTTYANSVTGASDTTLSDAVDSLVDGYGQGGGWSAEDIEAGAPTGDIVSTGTTIRASAYASSSITSYTNNVIEQPYGTAVAERAFNSCGSLKTVSMPKVYKMAQYVFTGCTAMTKLSVPKLTSIGNYSLQNCKALTAIALPSLNSAIAYLAQTCSALEVADLGSCTAINSMNFQSCTALRTLVLRRTAGVCTLSGFNNHLGGIYTNPTESTIYVPSALISSYQTASNWSSAYSAGVTFAAIEGSIYETKDANGEDLQ